MKTQNRARRSVQTKTQQMVLTAAFAAIIILMANVPFLGYIEIGIVRGTTIHIPVIIGAILLGPKAGALLGGVFGFTSFWKATFQPNLTSFCFSPFYSLGEFQGNFWSLVVCFVPRILIGITAYYAYKGLMKILKGKHKVKETIVLPIVGVVGSLTNTILVMGAIYLFFGEQYAKASEIAGSLIVAIGAIVVANGIPEAIACAILVTIITKPLLRFLNK